jgi:hypothetical protein
MNIPSGFILYRGSFDEAALARGHVNQTPNYMKNRPYYFLYNNANKNGANLANKAYGQVTVYKTIKPLKLVNLGSVRDVKMLLNSTDDKDIAKSIMKSFRIANKDVIRKSKLNHDLVVANFICRLGMDGYWTPKMRQKYGNKKFHQEIVLCHPKKSLRVVRVNQPSRPPSVAPKVRKHSSMNFNRNALNKLKLNFGNNNFNY